MENLGLSLSIASPASTAANNLPSRPLWPGFIPSSPVEKEMPLLKGFDVNRAPPVEKEIEEEDEYAGVSSANSTVSSVSAGKRGQREESENGPISEEEDGGEGSRKKLRLSRNQSAVLEESFKEHNTLNPKQKLALAKQLNLRPRQVEVWFQNRRARTKLKQTEVDCEFLKRCCENLTDENRRLHKEVQELRALKLSPQFYMQMTPPTTLTMCPSCERVAVSSSSTSSTSSTSTAVTAAATAANPSQNPDAHLHFAGSSAINQQYAQGLQKPQQHLFFPMRVESPARRTVP